MAITTFTRRRLLKALATGAGTLALPVRPRAAPDTLPPDVVVRLVAAPDSVPIWPGSRTRVLRFTAQVRAGRLDAVQPSTSYLGPMLVFRRGERVRIEFVNRLGEPSIVHWHGMVVPAIADGNPMAAVAPGAHYVYEFTVRNPAGTYLYHPHPHGRTGRQVYYGLAGLLIVRDDDERVAGLPAPEQELALVIQDRRIGTNRQFQFKGSMMDAMTGVLGDTVLVNGVVDAAFSVAPRTYRLRIANASNARIYKLAWSDGRPMHAIASDSGLFSRDEGMQTRPYIVLAPFQRVELLEDFGAMHRGTDITLVSQKFVDPESMGGGMMGGGMMGGGMMGGGMMDSMGSSQGTELQIARFVVASGAPGVPANLVLPAAPAAQAPAKRAMQTMLAFEGMRGTLNGRVFQMAAVANDERLALGEETVWTFDNTRPGHSMPHPMHIHGVRFRVLDRRGDIPADLRDGLIDTGYHDTVLVFGGEKVRIGITPSEPGLFMYHCHNLEHEDAGMMRNCWFGRLPESLR